MATWKGEGEGSMDRKAQWELIFNMMAVVTGKQVIGGNIGRDGVRLHFEQRNAIEGEFIVKSDTVDILDLIDQHKLQNST